MTELGLLAEQLGVNERTLRRAVNDGLLRAERPSSRRLEMSAGEKRYARHAWPLLSSLRGALRTEGNVRLALLFGSTARGDDAPGSDLDLLVEMRDDRMERVADLSTKLEELVGGRVEVVTVSSAEANPGLLANAIVEGRALVDRDSRWATLRKKERALRRSAGQGERRRRDAALEGIDRMPAV